MAIALSQPPMRSIDATWDEQRWEALEHDNGVRYEVIDGVLYMSTAPSWFHQWIVLQLALILVRQIRDRGLGIVGISPSGVFMPGATPVQPDLYVLLATQRPFVHDRHVYGAPALLVEVLSPNNPDLDTHTKRAAYARALAPEYWMVRPATRDILVCTGPDAELWDYTTTTLFSEHQELISPTLPVRFGVGELFEGAWDTTP